MTNNLFTTYIEKIAQRIDWLVTTCSSPYPNPSAREAARNHLNTEVIEMLKEVYEVGFVAGKKEATYNHDQRYRVDKFKLEKKLRNEIKKEIVEVVMKEYGVTDEKMKKKIVKKVVEDEPEEDGDN